MKNIKTKYFCYAILLALFGTFFTVKPHVAKASCYNFNPNIDRSYGTAAPAFFQSITSGGQTKIISIAHQNPVNMLQDLVFIGPDYYDPCQPVFYNGEGAPLGYAHVVESFITNTSTLPTAGFNVVYNGDPGCCSALGSFWVDPFNEITYTTAQDRINKEDAIIDKIRTSNVITARVGSGTGGGTVDVPATATNCVQLSPTGNPQRAIVFMRGGGWNSSVSDFLYKATDIRDRLLATDPFKTYQPSTQFSFYVDMKKQDQAATFSGNAATVKSQSSCGAGAFLYVYLFKDSTKTNFSYPGQKVAFLEYSSFTNVANGTLAAVREIGRALADIHDEFMNTTNTFGQFLTETNCTTDPFKAYRSTTTNHIYGAADQSGCFYQTTNDGHGYYRPNDESLMGSNYSQTQPTIPANRFNVISCGYIISAILAEPLTKDKALTHWPQCLTLDTAKNSVPPVAPKPTITHVSIIIPGRLATTTGTGFTHTGNSVQFTNTSNGKIYELTNIPSSDGTSLVFTVPPDMVYLPIDNAGYLFKVGALNSDWSDSLSVRAHSQPPSNLIATAPNRGKVKLSWTNDNSSEDASADKWSLHLEERIDDNSGDKFSVVRILLDVATTTIVLKDYPPSTTITYRINAEYGAGEFYSYSNEATVTTLPKPPAPVLLSADAYSDSATLPTWLTGGVIMVKWAIGDDLDFLKYAVHFKERGGEDNDYYSITVDDHTSSYSTQGVFVDNIKPDTEYCFTVKAFVNDFNQSDPSNEICVTIIPPSLFSIESSPGVLSVGLNSPYPNTQSVDLVVDGAVTDTDTSAPWSFDLNTNNLTDGPHPIYAVIHYPSPKPVDHTPITNINVNNNPPPLLASCTASALTVPAVGSPVYFQASYTGGASGLLPTFSWVGTDGLSGTGGSISKIYTNPGLKQAVVTVTLGSQTTSATCNINIPLLSSPPLPPTINLSVSPTSITKDQNTTITWNVYDTDQGGGLLGQNTYPCVASGAWSGSKSASGTQTVAAAAYLLYGPWRLTCHNSAGTTTKSVSVTIVTPPPPQPAITVLTPNGGESLSQGQSYPITWSAPGVSNIGIYLIKNNLNILTIAPNGTANSGTYTWTVPANISGTGFQIYVAAAGALPDRSNTTFTILAPPSVKLNVNVTGTGVGSVGSVTSTGVSGTINCSSGGNGGTACNVPFDPNTSITLYEYPQAGSAFTGWGGACSGTSNSCPLSLDSDKSVTANFNTVVSNIPLIKVSPDSGDFRVGSSIPVTWTTNAVPADTALAIDLVKYDTNGNVVTNYHIVTSTLNDGSESMPLPSFLTAGNYKVRIFGSVGASAFADMSDGMVALTVPVLSSAIAVLKPNGGETLVQGQPYQITWNATGMSNVGLYLLDDSTNILTIAPSAVNSGSYAWTVPTNLSGTDFQILVAAAGVLPDRSDATFTITTPPPVSRVGGSGNHSWIDYIRSQTAAVLGLFRGVLAGD